MFTSGAANAANGFQKWPAARPTVKHVSETAPNARAAADIGAPHTASARPRSATCCSAETEIIFSADGVFGVGRLATKFKELESQRQIGPWHVGQWTDFRHSAIHIRFSTRADGETAKQACRDTRLSRYR